MDYRLKARIYTDSGLNNANQFRNRLRIGRQTSFKPKHNQLHTLYLGPIFRLKIRNDIDRDDGTDREFGGTNIADQLSYMSDGFQAQYSIKSGSTTVRAHGEIERRNYKRAGDAAERDHVRYSSGANLSYRFSSTDRLKVGYTYSKQDYSERLARNLLGDTHSENLHREYQDNEIELSMRHQFSARLRAKIQYHLRDRTDRYVGYDDYLRHTFGLSVDARPLSRTRLSFNAKYASYNFPRAFAFNNPLQKNKTKDVASFNATVQYNLSRHLVLTGSLNYRNESNTDIRYRYDRTITSVGLGYKF